MSIEKTWSGINEQQDGDLSSLLQTARLSKLSSHNPLQKIRKNLLINMIWGVVICIMYVFIILYFQIWQVQAAIAFVLIFSLWALYTSYLNYTKLKTTISPAVPVLEELKRHHQSITGWMHTQQRVALFIYPVSAAGGFMLGGVLGSGKPVAAFMNNPAMIIILLITIIILVPACYYLAKWMFKIGFGKHLNALQQNIHDMEEEK